MFALHPKFILFASHDVLAPALVDARHRTTVEVTASAYEERLSPFSCCSGGCRPEYTLDQRRSTYWLCNLDLLENESEGCWIEYSFEEPQDIVDMRIAFYGGAHISQTIYVYVNGTYHSTVKSSGQTTGYQTFSLDTDETAKLRLYFDDKECSSHTCLGFDEVG